MITNKNTEKFRNTFMSGGIVNTETNLCALLPMLHFPDK